MSVFQVVLVIAVIAVIIASVLKSNGYNPGWLKSKGMDCVVFILNIVSLLISVETAGRIGKYVSDQNSPNVSSAVITGNIDEIAPVVLFITSIIMAIRLIHPKE